MSPHPLQSTHIGPILRSWGEVLMKVNAIKLMFAAGFLALAFVSSPAALRAQAAPGPIHPAPQTDSTDATPAPRPAPAKQYPPQKKENLVGAWKINPDESDDARQKINQAENKNSGGGSGGGNNPNSTGGGNSPYPGNGGNGPYGRPGSNSPYPGNGGGNSGGNGPYGRRSGTTNGTTYEDRQQLQDLIEPATSLAFTQKEGEVDVTDDQGRKRIYLTDSRRPQKSKDENYHEAAAHWEGARLIVEEKGPHGGRITRTYELSPDGKQLDESVRLDSAHLGLITVRYVFDVAAGPPIAPTAK
jgi:hypothetical protein